MWTTLTFLHIVIATLVTGHALLSKSEVRSAIGWIGLGWLSPFFGGAIYLAFGINRVARRASRINRIGNAADRSAQQPFDYMTLDENIRTIARVGDSVTATALTGGNDIKMLHGGDEAYPYMLAEIAGAQRTIALASYIFRPDRVGEDFISALTAAHQRGVQIRVLVDGIGSGYFSSPVIRHLHGAGIPARRFMHDWRPWQMSFINLRNHKKLMIIDGATAFTGGLNLGIENIWSGRRKRRVNDVHFRLQGPVVGQLTTSFAQDWHFTTGETLDGPTWWPPIEPAGSAVARGISSGPDEDIGKIEILLAAAIGQAKRTIRIVTPYFLPDERLRLAIDLAAMRGVRIELVIPERSDHIFMDWAVHSHLSFFPLESIQISLTSGVFDHSKLLTIDGDWCAIGSINWDVRSLRLNFEFLLESYHQQTIAQIDALIDRKISNGRLLATKELSARSLPEKLRDASARLLLPYL
jgi:cardiolipin synthase